MIGHVRHPQFGLAAIGDVLMGLDQVLRIAGLVEHGHAAGQEQPQPVLGGDRVLFGEQAAFLDRRLVARDDQLGFARIEDVGGGQTGRVLAAAIEDGLGAAVGEQVASVADALDDQRNRDVVDDEFEELLGAFQFARQRPPVGDVVEQVDQELRLVVLVAGDHAVGGDYAFLVAPFDEIFAVVMAFRRLQHRLVRDLDAPRGFRPEDLLGTLADDVVAGKAREALERAVDENIAAVLDALGGDTDRNVVEHQFQELRGRRQLARQPALLGAILVGTDRPAVGQAEHLREHRSPIRQFDDDTFRKAGERAEFLGGERHQASRTAQLDQFGTGHAAGNIGAGEPIHFDEAIVAEDDAVLRIGDDHSLIEIVQGGADECAAAQFGVPGPAQRRQGPEPQRRQEGDDGDAAEQQLPDLVGIERADIARRRKAAGLRCAPRRSAWRGGGDQAYEGQRRNRIPPACLPVRVSHYPPEGFAAGVSGLTGLDRVNDYPRNCKNAT